MKNYAIYISAFIISAILFFIIDADYIYNNEEYNIRYEKNVKEIVFIYIGNSQCIYSNSNELKSVIYTLKLDLQSDIQNMNLGFRSVGISSDWVVERGYNHLREFGNFNEIIVGNGWSNHGIIKYVGEMGIEASTPQIILLLRIYSTSLGSVVLKEKIIKTLTGRDSILKWHKEGAKLPAVFINEHLKN